MVKKRWLGPDKLKAFAVILLIILVFLLFFHPLTYGFLKEKSTFLISNFGFLGLFIVVVIMDTIIQPISPDILVFGSTFGGANLWLAALIGGLGSCLAGTFGYLIGRGIGKEGFSRWFDKKHMDKGHELFDKYGVWAVMVGALSPIPYSSICWTAGIYKMPFVPFLITSLITRIPRFFIMGFIGFLL